MLIHKAKEGMQAQMLSLCAASLVKKNTRMTTVPPYFINGFWMHFSFAGGILYVVSSSSSDNQLAE
jgi:hypothetical protein